MVHGGYGPPGRVQKAGVGVQAAALAGVLSFSSDLQMVVSSKALEEGSSGRTIARAR